MAKKSSKAKPAKKVAKVAKKAAKPVKKIAPKKIVAKKASKPVKKVAAKKVVAKKIAKPAKKKVVAKKVVAKKIVKPAKKKVAAKKIIAKKIAKPVKKVAAKKVVAKKIAKPEKKIVPKKEVKVKEVAKKIVAVPVVKTKPEPIFAKKQKYRKPTSRKKQREESLDEEPEHDSLYYQKIEIPAEVIRRLEKPQPAPAINTDVRKRYSDSELKEFKQLIHEKLDEAQKDYELLKSTLSHKDDNGTDDTSPTFKLLEDGSDVLSKEETAQLAIRQEKFMQSLQNALIRIENKTYGICRVTGKLISKERLRSVPHATLSIDAKLEQN